MSEREGRPAVKALGRYAIVIALLSSFVLVGPAEARDFTAKTSLGIKVKPAQIQKGQSVKISGHLKSPKNACVKDMKIQLFSKAKGKDWKQVAHTFTANDGSYKFTRHPKKTKKFQTKFPGKVSGVHPHHHVCLESESAVKKVKVT
jgi:hypothetical protein